MSPPRRWNPTRRTRSIPMYRSRLRWHRVAPNQGPSAGGQPVTDYRHLSHRCDERHLRRRRGGELLGGKRPAITATRPRARQVRPALLVTTAGGTFAANTPIPILSRRRSASSRRTRPKAGGTAVTITGTNLTGATSVTFAGAAAASFSVVNATTINATTPAGSAGTASVVVTTTGGGSSAANACSLARRPPCPPSLRPPARPRAAPL